MRAQAVRFENSKTILNADSATAMGEYYFTTLEGTVAKVEYTFQYKRGADGNLKIVVYEQANAITLPSSAVFSEDSEPDSKFVCLPSKNGKTSGNVKTNPLKSGLKKSIKSAIPTLM
mgnify:CR=1 FL=1